MFYTVHYIRPICIGSYSASNTRLNIRSASFLWSHYETRHPIDYSGTAGMQYLAFDRRRTGEKQLGYPGIPIHVLEWKFDLSDNAQSNFPSFV